VFVSSFRGAKEAIATVVTVVIETVATVVTVIVVTETEVIDTILEDIVILTLNVLIATVLVIGPAIALRNETKENAIIVENLDTNLENARNAKSA